MTIQRLSLAGFRSIREVELELSPLNVISGPNGCGKSNLYKAVRLLHEAASGRLSAALAEEGGIQKTMWAGEPKRGRLVATAGGWCLASRWMTTITSWRSVFLNR